MTPFFFVRGDAVDTADKDRLRDTVTAVAEAASAGACSFRLRLLLIRRFFIGCDDDEDDDDDLPFVADIGVSSSSLPSPRLDFPVDRFRLPDMVLF